MTERAPDPEIVLLVHGTGNAEPATAPVPAYWWENRSLFSTELLAKLGSHGRYKMEEPFLWGGANSETVRRTAGIALAKTLREWDAKDRHYHLVGHSHGGSVIWHALLHASSPAHPLKGLKSWTTVGTPYLRYQPDVLSLWPLIPLLVALVAGWQLFGMNPEAGQSIAGAWAFGSDQWLLVLLALLVAALAAIAIWAIWTVIGIVPPLVRQALKPQAEINAAKLYGHKALIVWHPDDEPINGLAASLIAPGEIFPRPVIDPRQPLWQRGLTRLRRLAAGVYAPPLDQLVWDVLARRVQGDDLSHERMVGAAPRPTARFASARAFDDTPPDLYADAADRGAGGIARNARRFLRDVASGRFGRLNLQQLSRIIDWSGIIHTSYFAHSHTEALIVARITGVGLVPPGAAAPGSVKAAYRPWLMTAALAGIAASFVVGLWGLASLMAANLILPYATDSLLDRIGAQYSDPLLAAVENSDLPGQLLTKLDVLPQFGQKGVIGSSAATLAGLPDTNSRFRSAAVYLTWLVSAALGDLEPVDDFLAEYEKLSPDAGSDISRLESSLLRLYALDAVAGQNRYLPFSEDHENRYAELVQSFSRDGVFLDRQVDVARALSVGRKLALDDLAAPFENILKDTAYDCAQVRPMALALIRYGRPAEAGALANTCTPAGMAEAALLLVALMRDDDPARALATLLFSIENEDANLASSAVVQGNAAMGAGPAAEVQAVGSFLLELAQLQDAGDLAGASARLAKFKQMPWSASAGLVIDNAESWTLVGTNFFGSDPTDWVSMFDILIADYRDTVMKRPPLMQTSVAQTERMISMMLDIAREEELEVLAKEWEAAAEQGGSQGASPSAALTHAALAYHGLHNAELAEIEKVKAVFSAALDGIADLDDDPAGFAVTIAEHVAELKDTALLERALGIATAEAIKTQDFETRARYLGRIATLQIARRNYPEGLRLVEAAGLPRERFLSLVDLNTTLFDEFVGEDTSEVRWTPGIAPVATTWLVDPLGPQLN